MLLRLGAAAIAGLLILPLGQAAAQPYPPSGGYSDRAAYPAAPPFDEGVEESVIAAPNPQEIVPGQPPAGAALPYPANAEPSALPPPGFAYPSQDAGPQGHIPGLQRTEAMPGQEAPPRPPGAINPEQRQSVISALPPEDQPEVGEPKELPPQFRRQIVDFSTKEPAGTIIIDTANTYLYLVLGKGQAMRYGIGVGREGFTWSGTERISRKAEWPDWYPPGEMIDRQPYLPRFMAGGPGNPLGARALYLGKTLYRIHGTNQPSTIGQFVSSGCVRLVNQDIEDLYDRVKVGSRVVVLPGKTPPPMAQAQPQTSRPAPIAAH